MMASDRPLVLDADGLNLLAQRNPMATLNARSALTVLTPHPGEFKRLFPQITAEGTPSSQAAEQAAAATAAIVVLKGARVAIAGPEGRVWINPDSTPALARGGSGDVLTGLIGGLLAPILRHPSPGDLGERVASAVWWHAQAGRWAAEHCTELGVDAWTLTQRLGPALNAALAQKISPTTGEG